MPLARDSPDWAAHRRFRRLQKVKRGVMADSHRIRSAMAAQDALVGLGDGLGDRGSRGQRVDALAEIIRQEETTSGEALVIWMRKARSLRMTGS